MAKTIAAVVTKRIPVPDGTGAWYFGTLTPDSEYETGGDTITKASAPELTLPEKIEFMQIGGSFVGGYRAVWDPATGKVKIFSSEATGTEAGSKEAKVKANLATSIFPFMAYGA